MNAKMNHKTLSKPNESEESLCILHDHVYLNNKSITKNNSGKSFTWLVTLFHNQTGKNGNELEDIFLTQTCS